MLSPGFKGRFGEYAFASKAALHGLVIGFPSVESIPFDFFVYNGKVSYKVQVKTNTKKFKGKQFILDFRKGSGTSKKVLTKEKREYSFVDVDFLIGFISETNTFYILPHSALPKSGLVNINNPEFDIYKNAWELLL